MRAYIDREILTIPVTASDIVQDDARAGTAAENTDQGRTAAAKNTAENSADVFGADALASEADELLSWIIATLPEAELAALITEANTVAAALRLTTRIEDLAGESATLAAWLNQ